MTRTTDEPAPWWLTEPLSIIELGDEFDVVQFGEEAFDPAAVVERMKCLNAKAAHVFPVGLFLDGRNLFFRHNSPGGPPPAFDYLEGWLRHARPADIRTIVYFNVHAANLQFARKHPDWQQRRLDGSPKEDLYNTDSTFCVNTPWRGWVFDRLRELCEYPIDGVFFDGPVVYPECCYCETCRAKFKERYGIELPDKSGRTYPDAPRVAQFQSDSLAAFLRDSRDVIKSIRTDVLFYMNSNPLGSVWDSARDNRKLALHQDILASEGGFLYSGLMHEPPWKVGMNAKLMEAEAAGAGIPTLVFNCICHNPWTLFMLTPAEIALSWASSIANGAGTWSATFKNTMHDPAVDAIGPLYAFARDHREDIWGTSSMARIAVMVSKATLNYRAGGFHKELQGWYFALWSMQVPFDLIDDTTAESEDLLRYQAIILPGCACLSAAACERLERFVSEGGTLIGSFETATHNEHGRRLDTLALAATFGAAPVDDSVSDSRGWDYLFRHGGGPWMDNVQVAYIPSPEHALNIEVTGEAETVLTFSKALPGRYGKLPEDSHRPAMVVHQHGQGRAISFACDFGAALLNWRMAGHLQIVRNIIVQCAPSPLHIPDAPACLEVSLRQTHDRRHILLHLVNYNGGMTRPITRVLPLHNLAVSLRLDSRPADVEALRTGQPLHWDYAEGVLSFTIPEIHEHAMIRIELAL